MQIEDFTVIRAEQLNARNTLLVLKPQDPDILQDFRPGQFVQVRIDGVRDVFLRRPISVHFIDKDRQELHLLVQQVGRGTEHLCQLQTGDPLNLVGPLGNGWDAQIRDRHRFLLVGGGVGIAPLLYLGQQLKAKGGEVHFLLGFKSQAEEMQLTEFQKYGQVHLSTDDGSDGQPGFVTQNPTLLQDPYDQVYVCGPTPMMRGVAHICSERHLPCQVSLENKMACGLGACLCCVTPDRTGHHLCVCTDGPVFNIESLGWK